MVEAGVGAEAGITMRKGIELDVVLIASERQPTKGIGV
jgi:hypothetical protein